MPNIEIIDAKRTCKCRLCNEPIKAGNECYVFRDVHISPHWVSLFFHCHCLVEGIHKAQHGEVANA